MTREKKDARECEPRVLSLMRALDVRANRNESFDQRFRCDLRNLRLRDAAFEPNNLIWKYDDVAGRKS